MTANNTQKTTAYIGIVLILSLGIFIGTRYEKPVPPSTKVDAPIQQQSSSATINPCLGNDSCSSQKKHVYNPSPSVDCPIGKADRCSAVFTVNGKRTDYSE